MWPSGTGGLTLETADIITDFNPEEDSIDLISGSTAGTFAGALTPGALTIVQGTGFYAADTIIQHGATGEYLAILQGFDASEINSINFI